jgi:hypothetical protein
MKRRRINDRIACGKCDVRRGSLSLLPGGGRVKRERGENCAGEDSEIESEDDNNGTMGAVGKGVSTKPKPQAQAR